MVFIIVVFETNVVVDQVCAVIVLILHSLPGTGKSLMARALKGQVALNSGQRMNLLSISPVWTEYILNLIIVLLLFIPFVSESIRSSLNYRSTCFIFQAVILSKWTGESEQAMKMCFQIAIENAPSILFFDEVDSLTQRSAVFITAAWLCCVKAH